MYGLMAITQRCSGNDESSSIFNKILKQNDGGDNCPSNSKCNSDGFCVCERGYFGNCQNTGQYINSQSKEFTIS